MLLNLNDLEYRARTLSLTAFRRSENVPEVTLFDDVALVFKNFPDENDNVFGFEATPWHTHDNLLWASTAGEIYEFGPGEVLSGLRSGELLVAARYLAGEINDMWIEHVRGLRDFEIHEAGEELRVRRLG